MSVGRAPEKSSLTIGIVPLTDCAPIAVAVERGLYEKRGLDVATTQERSWAGIRDKVSYGVLDAAQMLATMPLASAAGVIGYAGEFVTGMTLDLNGNAITLSTKLCQEVRDRLGDDWASPRTADALRPCIDARRAEGKPKLRLGAVFPMATHDLELRYWLASGGIDPENDVELVVVPPPSMVEALTAGRVDGFCVGEPWNSVAVDEGLGEIAITKHALWANGTEKVLGVKAEWAAQYPETHLAMIEATLEACIWLDDPAHRREACAILALPQYVNVEARLLERSMTGALVEAKGRDPVAVPDFHVFHRYQTNLPWRSQAMWFLSQMVRWGGVDPSLDLQGIAASTYREDIYRQAAENLGLPIPTQGRVTEGTHADEWLLPSDRGPVTMGPDRWVDDRTFDPDDPLRELGPFANPITPMPSHAG
ncbi:MAG: CmpA/NrtA family ABC transporter substrate-binding protein [Planctomycetota bacterium]